MKLHDIMEVIPYNSQVSIRDRRQNVLANNDVFSIKATETYKKSLKDREVYQAVAEHVGFEETKLVILVY